jgi:hypothetical protein
LTKAGNEQFPLTWYRTYYHFSRPHESLRLAHVFTNSNGEEVVRYRNRTPVMAAGLMRRRLMVKQLLLLPLAAEE